MKKIVLFLLLTAACVLSVSAATVRVAAAANLRFVLEEIKKQYEKEHPGTTLELTFGSSGTLTTQIINGAPFDVFMAADVDFPKKVEKAGFAASPVSTYVYGRVAMFSTTLDVTKGLKLLLSPAVKKISIADPKKAPYGENSVALLKNKGLYDKIASKIVWGENISQAAQFAFTGNAEVGFIAYSLAMAPDMAGKGKVYPLPVKDCPLIEQAHVLLKPAAGNAQAKDFMAYVVGKKAAKIWLKYGYALPKR
ncbi:MAG: molybdenum transporter, periplasmic molybdate-binding protein [Bacteroidetes bacterium]|nr:molybdenum transporter, periplasmic molybdate-binding protein [Bacteroidota bacterium]